jgi:hypothetical protein
MSLVGLDWNASRVLAVLGPAGDYPLPVPLEPPALELPAAVSLHGPRPEVGGAGLRHVREAPHVVCRNFLPELGASAARTWRHGRHALDAAQATRLVWQRLHGLCRDATGVVLAVPGYLDAGQADALRGLGTSLRLALLGSVPMPLAAALAGHALQHWSHSALVIDVDEHALTFALVRAVAEQAHVVEVRSLPPLGLRHWKERLVDAISDCCIWQTRRDPRDMPATEQGLYDQLDGLLDACARELPVQVALQGTTWYQHLLMQPEQTAAFCAPFVREAVRVAGEMLGGLAEGDPAGVVLLTHQASRLPGLQAALQGLYPAAGASETVIPRPRTAVEDFGENLLFESDEPTVGGVHVLPLDAPARAAHTLGELLLRGELPKGHLDGSAPLPLTQAVEAGPARLHCHGRDCVLKDPSVLLGSQHGCQVVFDPRQHPQVADRHCEIVFDRRTFLLFNRSRAGTLVNDAPVTGSVTLRAGDWIRLGPGGPALRFLGRPLPRTTLVTTA